MQVQKRSKSHASLLYCDRAESGSDIATKTRDVDLPVAVLTSIKKHNGNTVPVFRPQFRSLTSHGVDIDHFHRESEFGLKFGEDLVRHMAQMASAPGQERHVVVGCAHATTVPVGASEATGNFSHCARQLLDSLA